MNRQIALQLIAISLGTFIYASTAALAQEHKERTIDEIKVEAVHRAEVGGYPLIGLDPDDDLVPAHRVTLGLQPFAHLHFGDRFTDGGDYEFNAHDCGLPL